MSRLLILVLLILPLTTSATSLGTVSDDVLSLQRALNERGYSVTNYGDETRYFGPATEAALTRYQIDHAGDILGTTGIMNGLGTLDPLTKAHLMGNHASYGRMNVAALLAAAQTGTTRTITITLRGAGTVTTSSGQTCSLSPCVLTVPYKTRLSLTATPQSGNTFTSWSGACSGTTPSCTITMSRNRSVTATFSTVTTPPPETHTLTTGVTGDGTITGTGISCPTDCSEAYLCWLGRRVLRHNYLHYHHEPGTECLGDVHDDADATTLNHLGPHRGRVRDVHPRSTHPRPIRYGHHVDNTTYHERHRLL
jgi:peptidoglycan hydrolase-like protein with peptidoglycan-binding domain